MIYFYAFDRKADAVPDGCDQVWLDYPQTGRSERMDMVLAVKSGDTVIVRARGDLGRGAEAAGIRKQIEAKGATVVVEPLQVPSGKPGRPAEWSLPAEHRKFAEGLYRSAAPMDYVLDRIGEKTGQRPSRHQLYRIFKPRWKEPK